jgi:GNAT superfamily N-acetyltransferase
MTTVDTVTIGLALDVNFRNLALGHDVDERSDATFVRNRGLPRIYDANFAFGVRAAGPAEIETLLSDARTYFAHAERLTFRCDPRTPPEFEATLALEGFEMTTALMLILHGPLMRPAPRADIRDVTDGASWGDYVALKRLDWTEHATRVGIAAEPQIADDLATAARLKAPPARYLIAYVEGQPVGYCQAWHGVHGLGQVEDLYVLPRARGRGVATSLLHAAVDRARDGGAGPVIIVADPADTPRIMYRNLGWRPVALVRQWGKGRG